MTRRFGIDTSVLVRLLTGEPPADFAPCVRKLKSPIEEEGAEVLVSNQVIGEAYIAVQHHYGVSRDDARAGLLDVLCSGLVSPLNGGTALAAIEARRGAGLLDGLIADDYVRAGLAVPTLDRKMSTLPGVRRPRMDGIDGERATRRRPPQPFSGRASLGGLEHHQPRRGQIIAACRQSIRRPRTSAGSGSPACQPLARNPLPGHAAAKDEGGGEDPVRAGAHQDHPVVGLRHRPHRGRTWCACPDGNCTHTIDLEFRSPEWNRP